jgi:hypothetical protein
MLSAFCGSPTNLAVRTVENHLVIRLRYVTNDRWIPRKNKQNAKTYYGFRVEENNVLQR